MPSAVAYFWGGTDGDPIQVIGVVGNVRDFALDEPAPPMLFLSAYQLVMPSMTMLVRTRGEMSGLASSIRSAVWALNPGVAVPSVQSVEQYRTDALAQPHALRILVLRRTALLMVAGLALGIVAALALGRFVRALLYETAPNDPLSFVALPALLALVALAAAYVPARRAATLDPLGLLRAD